MFRTYSTFVGGCCPTFGLKNECSEDKLTGDKLSGASMTYEKMFATLVSDSIKQRKTVDGFLSKESHEIKTSVYKDLQKQKSSVFIDCLVSGFVQSYVDLFFIDKHTACR